MPRWLALVFAAGLGISTQQSTNAWLFFVDDLHIEFIQTGRLRTLLRSAAGELIHDGDRYLLRASGPSQKSLPAAVSADRELLAPAIRFMTGNGLQAVDITREIPTAAMNEVLIRANRSLDAADSGLTALAAENAPRKAIVLVSWGYDIDAFPAVADRVTSLARRATESGVTIFAIDARGFDLDPLPDSRVDAAAWQRYLTSTRLSLSLLAQGTGGFVIERAISPTEHLHRIRDQMR